MQETGSVGLRTVVEDSTPALSPEAENSPRAVLLGGSRELIGTINDTAVLGDSRSLSPPPAPVKSRVAFQTPRTTSKVSSLFRQMTLDDIFDNESLDHDIHDIHEASNNKRKRHDTVTKQPKAPVVRNLSPSWQSKEI